MNINGGKIDVRESNRGWVILIIPNDIRIDNYHGFTHIHHKSSGIHIPINNDNLNLIKDIIKFHFLHNRNIKNDLLIKELKRTLND